MSTQYVPICLYSRVLQIDRIEPDVFRELERLSIRLAIIEAYPSKPVDFSHRGFKPFRPQMVGHFNQPSFVFAEVLSGIAAILQFNDCNRETRP